MFLKISLISNVFCKEYCLKCHFDKYAISSEGIKHGLAGGQKFYSWRAIG
jgi:hypothetical protein